MGRRWKVSAAAAALALAVASCTSGPTEGGEVTAYSADFATLDPARCLETACFEIIHRLFDPPVGYDPVSAELEPAAATDWTVSEDATQITFSLREDASFHNGEPVDAASFVRGLTRAAAAASEAAGNLQGIKGLGAVQSGKAETLAGVHEGANEFELVIELTDPDPEFVLRMGHAVFSPVPEALDEDSFGESPIGNGPYELVSFDRGESVEVSRFTGYTGERPGFLDAITWNIFDSLSTAYTAFQDDDLQVGIVPRELFEEAETTFGDAFVTQPVTTDVLFMAAATGGGPTASADFRRAVSQALDRSLIVGDTLGGDLTPADAYIPPGTTGHRSGVCDYCVHDVDAAADHLALAGGVPDEPVVLYSASDDNTLWLLNAKDQLEKNLGLTVEIQGWDPSSDCAFFTTFLAIAGPPACGEPDPERSFNSGFFVLSWTQDFPTPGHWLSLMESSNDFLFSGWSDEAYDELVAEGRSTIEDDDRLSLFQQAEDRLLDQMPVLPLWYDTAGLVYDQDVIGTFVVDFQTGTPFWEGIALA